MPFKSKKEGNLEAPIRHDIDWKNPEYYNEEKLNEELERAFDICHSCRRCVNLCASFPTLFDLVDNSETLEVDGVAKSDYQKVVEQCYLCDMCYVAKCPYVPPHPFNIDFPHLMLQAKAIDNQKRGGKWKDKVLSATDKLGKMGSIPIVNETINAVNTWEPTRALAEKTLGIDRRAWLPRFEKNVFRKTAEPQQTIRSQLMVNEPLGKSQFFQVVMLITLSLE